MLRNRKDDKIPIRVPKSELSQRPGRIFSYHSNRSQSENERPRSDTFDQKTKSKNRNLRHIPTILAAVIIFVSVAYSLILDIRQPDIVPLVTVTPSILRDNDYYQHQVEKVLSGSFLNRTKVTIDTKKIEEQLLKELPELDKVSVNIPLIGKSPVVQLSPIKPSLIVSSQNGSYVVGANGKVLMKLSEMPDVNKSELIKASDEIVSSIAPGDTILPVATIDFIDNVSHQFKQKGIAIDSVKFPAIANEIHIQPKDFNYSVRFNLQNDAKEQVGSYFALLDKLKNDNGASPAEYVDVRIQDRVYYK